MPMMDEILRRSGGTYLSTAAAIPRAIPFLATERSFEMDAEHPVLADQNFEISNIPAALDDWVSITSTLLRIYSLVPLSIKYLAIEKMHSFAHTEAYAIHHIIYIENKRALR